MSDSAFPKLCSKAYGLAWTICSNDAPSLSAMNLLIGSAHRGYELALAACQVLRSFPAKDLWSQNVPESQGVRPMFQ
jgi:hypothetical protein